MLNGFFRPCLLALIVVFSMLTTISFSQSFSGDPVHVFDPNLNQRFSEWAVFRLDANGLDAAAQQTAANGSPLYLNLGKYHWALHMEANDIFDPNYKIHYQGINDEYDVQPSVIPYKGVANNNQDILRLTLGKDFFYGYVEQNGEKIYIEPLWYSNPAFDKDLFLVYNETAVIKDNLTGTCGTSAESIMGDHVSEKIETAENISACYQLDLAIASDASMLTKYGSVGSVQAHNIGVINDVEGDYTGSFTHDIHFNIVIQFISAADPWGSNANAGTYLGNFRAWGNNGGFGISYDLAEMWTNIDFTGSTIGIAYVPGLCTSNKYHCLQDFSSNADFLRCMTSHEIGHNFGCQHDAAGSQTIMAPSVSAATSWSAASTSSINSYTNSMITNGCLTPCITGPPPTPAFTWSPDPGCKSQPVTFSSQSTGTVLTYLWSFPGGTPTSSTLESPTVVYNTAGVKNVTLTLNSGTSIQAVLSKQVTIISDPTANFTSIVDDLTVSFTSTTSNATSYNWDFGDGDSSSDPNPVHTYAEANTYLVVLTVTGPCGTATKTLLVNTAPSAMFMANPSTGCVPLAVSFANQSSPNAVTYAWQFPGGTPAASNQVNPVVIYQTSGVYTVTLTAINAVGSNTFSIQSYINVQTIPATTFTSVANGLTVTFNNTSVGGVSYLWNFGDGQTSTMTNPVHTYATGGAYIVTLSTTNTCGSTNNTQTVVLATPPVAAFTAAPSSGCAPLTVQFTDNSSNATSILWSFPGGMPATSTAANPVVVYDTPGSYTASLTATNVAGPNIATQVITVQTVPAPAFAVAVNSAVASFTNSTSGATSYSWSFGDGEVSPLENPTHTYLNDGVYQVILTSINSCGTSTTTQTVTIVTPPAAFFTANSTTGCAPFTVQLNNNSSSNATSFAWQFPGGSPATSTATNPTVVYSTPGEYTVTLVATNAAGSSTATQTNYIQVITTPTATFTSAINGLQVNFTNTTANSTSYAWDFGDGGTSILENPIHTYSVAGNYAVTLAATNICGNGTTTQTVVTVESPTAAFSATPTTGCNNITVQFNNSSSGNPTSFSWLFPGGMPSSSTLANPEVVYAAPGTYSVTFTATNTAGSGTTTQTNLINVGTAPTAGFTSTNNANLYSFNNASAGGTSYSWDFGDTGTSTANNPTHSYTMDGTYTVVLTAINACGTNTSTQTVTVVTPPVANFTATGGFGCSPLTVVFNNTSSPNANSFAWQFPGGNPAFSTASNPTVIYSSPGVYSVNLTATNNAGSSNVTQTNFVTVETIPSPNFVASNNGASFNFSNASAGATAYSWNFGDSQTSTLENPNHYYLADGTYTVVLTASNACGTATSTQTVTVTTPPVANFTAAGNNGCAPITVTFNNTSSSNAAGFSWQFPGGDPASSTDSNPVVNYTTPGIYAVILTASNAAGNSTVTQTDFVVAGGEPTAIFLTAVNGAELTLNNTSSGATSYLWDFGDGLTSTQEAPTHTYSADGSYTIVLTSSNNCGTATSTQTVLVVTAPVANFAVSATAGCTPFTVVFDNQSSANATSYEWTFQGGIPAISTDENPSVVYNNPGIYSATLMATNAAGSSTVVKSNLIQVNTTPVTAFTVQTGGLSAEFTNGSYNAQSFFWDFGDGGTSTDVNPVHDYGAPGTYTVVLKAINDCGSAEFTLPVTIVGSAPIPAFSAGDQTKGCAPLSVQFTDESVGQPNAWLWTFPNGTPSTATVQNPIVVYATPGIYDVTLQVSNSFGTNTLVQPSVIEVLPTPLALFESSIAGATVTLSNLSQNATSYQWNFGDGSPVSSLQNPNHVYAQTGTYTVSLTALNDCGSALYQITVAVTVVGTDELADWAQEVRLFPNPNNGKFTLDIKGLPKEELQFEMFNSIGQLIKRDVHAFNTGKMSRLFDYGPLPVGNYLLRVSDYSSSFVIHVAITK